MDARGRRRSAAMSLRRHSLRGSRWSTGSRWSPTSAITTPTSTSAGRRSRSGCRRIPRAASPPTTSRWRARSTGSSAKTAATSVRPSPQRAAAAPGLLSTAGSTADSSAGWARLTSDGSSGDADLGRGHRRQHREDAGHRRGRQRCLPSDVDDSDLPPPTTASRACANDLSARSSALFQKYRVNISNMTIPPEPSASAAGPICDAVRSVRQGRVIRPRDASPGRAQTLAFCCANPSAERPIFRLQTGHA